MFDTRTRLFFFACLKDAALKKNRLQRRPKSGGSSSATLCLKNIIFRLLTEEVGRKSSSISVLDQEKSALIRELFQARSKLRQAEMGGDGEITFM